MAYQNEKRNYQVPSGIIMMALLFLMLPGLSPAQDQPPGLPGANPAQDQRLDDKFVTTQKVEATIIKKRADSIQTKENYFVVYTATRVFLMDPETGKELKEITMAELAYPCRAIIHYEVPLSNKFHARRIEVIKTATGARTEWSRELPQ